MGTFITAAILITAAGLAVRSMVRDKKKGKSLQCGGDCSRCKGCH
ncbi:MAG: FeoB-associated Cys-rich membrane protein [Lachnospiraceae bacterium]|nr:FeoB-associated Cys-rich membrane protein [Lachnospiraceae bacterium]